MKESVAVAKEADRKQEFSPTKSSDSSIQHLRDEPDRQIGSLRDVIGNIRSNGGKPSVESIAMQMSGMPTGEYASVLLALQQMHGNRYVQRVVVGIQAKLAVGQPGDIYEQEADRIADEVMRMPEPEIQRQEGEEQEEEILQTKPHIDQITPLVQRLVEEEEELLQAMSMEDTTPEVSNDLESQINAIKGGGRHMAESELAYFEPRFGVDFSRVKVHTGAQAAESARAMNARAFTIGRDVVFSTGEYSSDTLTGRNLLAHELTHVLQQTNVLNGRSVRSTAVSVQRVVSEEERRNAALLVGELQIELAGIECMVEQHQDGGNEEEEQHYSLWAAGVDERIIALRALARGEEHEDGRRYLGQSVTQLVQEAERLVGEAAAGEVALRESEVDLAQLETALRIQIAHATLALESGRRSGDADAAARASLVQTFLTEKLESVRRVIRGEAVARRALGSLRGAPGDIIQRWVRAAATGLRERISDRAMEEEMAILQRRVAIVQRRRERLERLLSQAETIYRSAVAEGAAQAVLIEGLGHTTRAVTTARTGISPPSSRFADVGMLTTQARGAVHQAASAVRSTATAPLWLLAVRVINMRYNVISGISPPGEAFALMRENFSRIAQYREEFAQFMATRDDLEQNQDIVFLMEHGLDGVRDEATAVADEMEAILARLSELATAE